MPRPRTELDNRAWRRLSAAVIARDQHTCQIRGPHCTRIATTTDHIVARVEGGAVWDPANLRAACRQCNGEGGGRAGQRHSARYAPRIPLP